MDATARPHGASGGSGGQEEDAMVERVRDASSTIYGQIRSPHSTCRHVPYSANGTTRRFCLHLSGEKDQTVMPFPG